MLAESSLNAWLSERLVPAEESSSKLRTRHPHMVGWQGYLPKAEGAVDLRVLVLMALRMRPDRVVIGEVRGGEAKTQRFSSPPR